MFKLNIGTSNKQFMYQKQHTSRYENYNETESSFNSNISNSQASNNSMFNTNNNYNNYYNSNSNNVSTDYEMRDKGSFKQERNLAAESSQDCQSDVVKSSDSYNRTQSRSKSSSNLSRSRSSSGHKSRSSSSGNSMNSHRKSKTRSSHKRLKKSDESSKNSSSSPSSSGKQPAAVPSQGKSPGNDKKKELSTKSNEASNQSRRSMEDSQMSFNESYNESSHKRHEQDSNSVESARINEPLHSDAPAKSKNERGELSNDKREQMDVEAKENSLPSNQQALVKPSDSNHVGQPQLHHSLFEPVLLSTIEDVNKYYKPDLLYRLTGVDLNEVSFS